MGIKETFEKAADSIIKSAKETMGIEEERERTRGTGVDMPESGFSGEVEPELAGEHPEPLYMSEMESEEEAYEEAAYFDTGLIGAGFKRDFVDNIRDTADARANEQNVRPQMEVWPFEDDWGHWVLSHEDPARSVVCNTPEFKDSPYCGHGVH
ncbi:hypothetical protein [Desulfomonile tiedjei]|uniref:Uncharacterized protein n=1 Tax=Desulfomonile tiedjei (strain ATCC 49306 / DSM 6799 / DCB-1) TaxID=706587 RepID=I4C374_DESTA|nr:hypothetical protein [Desulfomonile tiedjei]AFM24015.1 hypothetical protein Desti_1302 [Desulfomonile tiedjei DSM 6799]